MSKEISIRELQDFVGGKHISYYNAMQIARELLTLKLEKQQKQKSCEHYEG